MSDFSFEKELVVINRDRKSITLARFKRESARVVKALRRDGQPIVLTAQGKPALVVQTVASYKRLVA